MAYLTGSFQVIARACHTSSPCDEHQRVRALQKSIEIRALGRADLPAVRVILDRTGLFPSDLLQPMVEPFLAEQSCHHWLVALGESRVLGFAYAEPERMTDGTFNLLAIAIDPAVQRQGIGKALVQSLIEQLRQQGGRILIVETSSLDDYAETRAFYAGQSFGEEARIREFYARGEDKLVFWKSL